MSTKTSLLDVFVKRRSSASSVFESKQGSISSQLFLRDVACLLNDITRLSLAETTEELCCLCTYLRPGYDLVVALHAVITIGTYVPLDPARPSAHITNIISNVAPLGVLTNGELRSHVDNFNGPILDVSSTLSRERAEGYPRVNACADTNRTIYIVHTSGSTGKPKGVPGTGPGLENRLLWFLEEFPYSSEDCRVACKTSPLFVDSLLELVLPVVGDAVIVSPECHASDIQYFVAELRDLDCSRLVVVPTLVRLLRDYDELKKLKISFWFLSGEPLTVDTTICLLRNSKCSVVNLYGSSEVMDATASVWNEDNVRDVSSIDVGEPIRKTEAFLKAHEDFETLYIRGPCVSPGYFKLPKETAACFIERENDKYTTFSTGDLASISPLNKRIQIHGRADDEVKINGNRVKLCAVESVLIQLKPWLVEVVVRKKSEDGFDRLLAFVELSDSSDGIISERHCAAWLQVHLPDYMQVNEFFVVPKWPTLASGKLDKKSLSSKEFTRMSKTSKYNPSQSFFLVPCTNETRDFAELLGTPSDGSWCTDQMWNFLIWRAFDVVLVDSDTAFSCPGCSGSNEQWSSKVPHTSSDKSIKCTKIDIMAIEQEIRNISFVSDVFLVLSSSGLPFTLAAAVYVKFTASLSKNDSKNIPSILRGMFPPTLNLDKIFQIRQWPALHCDRRVLRQQLQSLDSVQIYDGNVTLLPACLKELLPGVDNDLTLDICLTSLQRFRLHAELRSLSDSISYKDLFRCSTIAHYAALWKEHCSLAEVAKESEGKMEPGGGYTAHKDLDFQYNSQWHVLGLFGIGICCHHMYIYNTRLDHNTVLNTMDAALACYPFLSGKIVFKDGALMSIARQPIFEVHEIEEIPLGEMLSCNYPIQHARDSGFLCSTPPSIDCTFCVRLTVSESSSVLSISYLHAVADGTTIEAFFETWGKYLRTRKISVTKCVTIKKPQMALPAIASVAVNIYVNTFFQVVKRKTLRDLTFSLLNVLSRCGCMLALVEGHRFLCKQFESARPHQAYVLKCKVPMSVEHSQGLQSWLLRCKLYRALGESLLKEHPDVSLSSYVRFEWLVGGHDAPCMHQDEKYILNNHFPSVKGSISIEIESLLSCDVDELLHKILSSSEENTPSTFGNKAIIEVNDFVMYAKASQCLSFADIDPIQLHVYEENPHYSEGEANAINLEGQLDLQGILRISMAAAENFPHLHPIAKLTEALIAPSTT